ncbi:MAG: S1C family serine protease [Burkholderiales bacterium]
MKRAALYSSSSRRPGRTTRDAPRGASAPPIAPPPEQAAAAPAGAPHPPLRPSPGRRFVNRYERAFLVAGGALFALLVVATYGAMQSPTRQITQKDIDKAVLHTLENTQLPSKAAKAYEIIGPSVVRVRGFTDIDDPGQDPERGVGSGVVIIEDGTILTNLHVVASAKRVKVVFADGTESDAKVVGLRPEHDLAILKASTLPDDLVPATMRSTADLAMGDEVVAVGFPFAIGPSVSAGVVSGLKREFRSPEGKRQLTNLIQFDAAANPGSSGGPLVTMDGEVVGIVTAILNPTEQRVFIGIGFAVPIENAAGGVGLSPF